MSTGSTGGAPVGAHRGGVVNTTQTYDNSTPGLQNVTPRFGAANAPGGDIGSTNYGIDIDNGSYNKGAAYDTTGPHQDQRLLSIVDRIVNRAGPPQSSLGNPGPLGLAAFAATTFMLSCYNASLLVSTTQNIVLPMALWYGGIAQLLAGMWEFAANNTFGATAFTSYGAFWLSYATIGEFWAPTGFAAAKDVSAAVGLFLMAWSIFTGYMFLASLRMSWSLVTVFGLLEITFACLCAAEFTADPQGALDVQKAGGWFGIFTAFAAWYASAAVVINGTFGAQLVPVGVIGPLTHRSMVVRSSPSLRRRLTGSVPAVEEEADEPGIPKQA